MQQPLRSPSPRRLLTNLIGNVTSLVLALVLAVIIWAAATQESNPMSERTFEVPLRLVMRADGILLNTPPERVLLGVEAPQRTLDQLSAADFEAYIDLEGAEFGRAERAILPGYLGNLNMDLATYDVFPQVAVIELDRRVQKDLPVRVELQGSVARTHELRSATTDPLTVTVSGPATRVATLSEARATIFLDNARESRSTVRPLSFYDTQGNVANVNGGDLEISTNRATVNLTVAERDDFADVTIQVNLSGRPADGYRFLSAVPQPRSVLVSGAPTLLDNLRSIETEPIDITGLAISETLRVSLLLPEGITLVDAEPVFVTIDVEQIFTSDFYIKPPQINGLSDVMTATVDPPEVTVVLFGPLQALEALRDDEVRVTLDLFGLISGTYQLTPTVSVAVPGIDVRNVEPRRVTVTITETVAPDERSARPGGVGWRTLAPADARAGTHDPLERPIARPAAIALPPRWRRLIA